MTQAQPALFLELTDPHGGRTLLTGAEMVAGRSRECAIRLADELASRRHFILRNSPFGWQLSDLDSSNGTFVNGRRLQRNDHWILSPGDRVTVGKLTLIVREAGQAGAGDGGPQAVPAPRRLLDARQAPSAPPSFAGRQFGAWAQKSANEQISSGWYAETLPAWRWVVLVSGALAMGLLLASAFSPWVRIEAKLTLANVPGGEIIANAARVVQGIVQTVLGTPQPPETAQPAQTTFRLLEQTVGGMDTHAYGLVVLGIAIVTALTLVLDIALVPARRGAFGLVYLLLGLAPGVLLLVEYARFDQLARQPVLFGIDVAALFKVSQQLMDIRVRPLIGIWLLGAGLLLLLATGILRIMFPVKG